MRFKKRVSLGAVVTGLVALTAIVGVAIAQPVKGTNGDDTLDRHGPPRRDLRLCGQRHDQRLRRLRRHPRGRRQRHRRTAATATTSCVGGQGDDTLYGGPRATSSSPSAAWTSTYGGDGNDDLWAMAHADVERKAGEPADTLYGENGNDASTSATARPTPSTAVTATTWCLRTARTRSRRLRGRLPQGRRLAEEALEEGRQGGLTALHRAPTTPRGAREFPLGAGAPSPPGPCRSRSGRSTRTAPRRRRRRSIASLRCSSSPGAARGDHRDLDRVGHRAGQLQVVAVLGAVAVHAGEQDLPRAALGALARPLDRRRCPVATRPPLT